MRPTYLACDTRSHSASELAEWRTDDVGRVAPGECSIPVPALACAAGLACRGAKPREKSKGPPLHPGINRRGEDRAGERE